MPNNRLEEYRRNHRRCIVAILLAAALLARLIGLTRGMWVDELKTWMVEQWPIGDMLGNRFWEGHLPLYFLIIRPWIQWVGPVDWALRLPSAAMGVAGVYLLLRLGEEGYARRVAFGGAALLAVHQVDLWASQNVRMYALLAFLCLAASLQLMRLERTSRWRNFAGFLLCSAAGLMTQALYAFVMLGQLAYFLWNGFFPPEARLRAAVGARAGILHGFAWRWKLFAGWAAAWLITAPVWYILKTKQWHISGEMKNFGEVSVERMLRSLTRAVIGDYETLNCGQWLQVPAYVCMGIAAGLLLAGLIRRRFIARIATSDGAALPDAAAKDSPDERAGATNEECALINARRLTRYLICSVGVYALAMFVFSNTFLNKAGSVRYYTPLAAPICLGFAAAIYLIPVASLRRAFMVFIIAALSVSSVAWWRYPGDGLAQAARDIEARRAPDERVIGCNDTATFNAYCFYFPQAVKTAYVPISRYLAVYPVKTQKAIEDLRDIEKSGTTAIEAQLRRDYRKRPEKLKNLLVFFRFLYGGDELDDSFWKLAYQDGEDCYEQLPELRRRLLENAPAGKRLWLLLYNNEGSPLAELARSMKEFETVERTRINDAQVILLKRK